MKSTIRRACVAITIAAAMTTGVTLPTAVAADFVSCGVQPGDPAIASQLNAKGARIHGGVISTEQVACARVILTVTKNRGLVRRAGEIAIITAIQESRVRNVNYGADDSLGLFQQRPSQGWGTPAQIMQPVYSTGKFLDKMVNVSNWQTRPRGDVAQAVQISCCPAYYEPHVPDAIKIVDALWSAQPAWSGWENLGGELTQGVAAINRWGHNLEVYGVGADKSVWVRGWTGSAWTAWREIGGTLTSDPAAASWTSARVDLFGRGVDGKLIHSTSTNAGTSFGAWESMGVDIIGSPAVASWGPERLDVFARSTTNTLIHSAFAGGVWGPWEDLGGNITTDPAVASWGPGRLDIFAGGLDHGLYHKRWASGWSAWEDLGGNITSAPAVASGAVNKLDVIARGTDNSIWHRAWNGSTWQGWSEIGGTITANPEIISWGGTRLDIFARGGDNGLYHIRRN